MLALACEALPMESIMGMKNITGVRREKRSSTLRWVIDFRFTNKDGKRVRFRQDASVQNYAAALAEAKRLMALAAENGTVEQLPVVAETSPLAVTFEEFVVGPFESLFMPSYRPATATRYRGLLRQSILAKFRGLRLDQINIGHIREYAAEIQRRGHQTKPMIAYLRTILRAAVDSGHLDKLPEFPKGLMRSSHKLPDAPGATDVEAMLTASGWLGVAIALAALAGMRCGEVRALEVRDVDFEGGRILVRRALSEDISLTTKSGRERVVPLVPVLEARLREAVKGKLPLARIVVWPDGVTPRRQEVLYQFWKHLRERGIRRWSFHSLRHHFISELVRRGASLEAVRVLAGHSKLEMTQRYAHATAADLRSAMDKLAAK
jgi:integrase